MSSKRIRVISGSSTLTMMIGNCPRLRWAWFVGCMSVGYILLLMNEASVLTIGNFDGVHLGHRAILARARQAADGLGARVKALTFEPHPASILRPGLQPARVCDAQERAGLLRQAGADEVVFLKPSRELLGLAPQAFVERLIEEHHPAAIVEGSDFRFGRGRDGDVEQLAQWGERFGFSVQVVSPVRVALHDQLSAVVSSSLTRWLIERGRVADVACCLGRWLSLSAKVVQGEKRGRAIGVPTANLDPAVAVGRAMPAAGVYAGWVGIDDEVSHPAAISIGMKPTFAGQSLAIEAHVLDFSGDLYGRSITIHLARWLRDQQRFPGLDALKGQLGRDINLTRRWHELGLLEFHGVDQNQLNVDETQPAPSACANDL